MRPAKEGSRSSGSPLVFRWLEAPFFCGARVPSDSFYRPVFGAFAQSAEPTALGFRAGWETMGYSAAESLLLRLRMHTPVHRRPFSNDRMWLYSTMLVSARIGSYTVCQLEFLQRHLSEWGELVRRKIDAYRCT